MRLPTKSTTPHVTFIPEFLVRYLAPNERVKYTFGMVLGEKDFRQEQVHFEWKHQISNLLLHGYGTVCGLRVSARAVTDPSDVEIVISAGYGISPHGKWMWVEHDQCARLGEWLQKHRLEHSPLPGPGRETLYVKLCYVECPTEFVPITGQACASDEDTRAPSRIHEAFQAEFSWQPPDQQAENLYREFGKLLGNVEIISELESPVASDDRERFLDYVRNLGKKASPPFGSPLEGERFRLSRQTACKTIRQALVIWVTEVCPRITPDLKQDADDCILLARISFNVDTNGDLIPGSIDIASDERPVLVSDRLKQELFCLMERGETSGLVDHGALDGLLDDDHPQYLLTNGGRALTGDLSAGGNHITNLAEAGANGDAVPFEQAVKVNDAAGGDLSGQYRDPTVAGLQGRAVATTVPNDAQVLTWNQGASQWEPQAVAGGGTFVQIPASAGPYAIVAAGFFDSQGRSQGPVYNNLKATPLSTLRGEYVLSFPRYRSPNPDKGFMYIVKGTVQEAKDPRATFQFVRFGQDGIRVRVLAVDNESIPPGFMVEISVFGKISELLQG